MGTRGRPIRRSRIVCEPPKMTASNVADNLDPNFHYAWVHKDGQNGEEDMATWIGLGYEPARGSEKVKATPFSTPANHPDGLKIRGNRVLMRCPMSEYLKRKQDAHELQEKRVGRNSNQQDARQIARETGISPGLVSVEETDDDPGSDMDAVTA